MPAITAGSLLAIIGGTAAVTAGTQAVLANQSRIANEKANDKVKDANDKVLREQKAIKDQEEANALSTAARIAARRKQRELAGESQGRAGTIQTSQVGIPGAGQGATKQLIGE